MKNVIKNAIIALLFIMSANANAGEGIDVKLDGNQTIEIALKEKGTLTFQDRKGEILYKDSCVNGDSYKRHINLAEIPEGTYFLKFDKDDSILTSEIVKTKSGINIDKSSSTIVFKPVFKVNGKMVNFLLSNPTEGKVRLRVYDVKGVLVGKAEEKEGYVFKRTLDFSSMPAGDYTISLTVGENNFVKVLSI